MALAIDIEYEKFLIRKSRYIIAGAVAPTSSSAEQDILLQ